MCARLLAQLTCLSVLVDVFALQLVRNTPAHVHVTTGYTNVTFSCEADGPISDCHFRWRNEIRRRSGPILDLSDGLRSSVNESALGKDVLWYHYSGEGLQAGHCGVTLYIKGVKQYTVSCRVRAKDSGWRYGLMTLFADSYAEVPVEVSSMQQVAVGDQLSLMCKTKSSQKLNSCRFYLPGFGTVNMDAGRESPSPSTHHYYGAGLEQGECGLTLKAKDINNGMVSCTVDTSRRDLEWNTIPIIVTRPPDWIKLEVTKMSSSPVFHARCTVGGSRPAATITWLLDDQVLREDNENDDVNATWTWPYQPQTVTQVLNVSVEPGQQPQRLTCRADHPALTAALLDSKELALDSTHCPEGDSVSTELTCEWQGEEAACASAMVGTIQQMACKPGYVAKNSPAVVTRQCLQGGAWDKEIMKCVADCGRLVNHTDETMEQTDEPLVNFFWHVGIYEESDELFKYICGGSLISTKFVISGARCFWDGHRKQKKEPALLRVATGKMNQEWTDVEDTQVQWRNVSKVIFHDRFSGFEGQFKFDIALLQLLSPFQVTDSVNIVCVDWERQWEKTHLWDNNTGLLVGLGLTEDGSMTANQSHVNLKYVQNSTCLAQVPEDSRALLTEDKFCARSESEAKSLCPGDVGGGLVFPELSSRKMYLRGIASVGFSNHTADTCQPQYYISFTSLAAYIEWINSVTGLFPSRQSI